MKVSLYIESYCPDCEVFVTKDLVEFRKLDDMMAITDIDIVPYGNAKVLTRDPPTFKCQHGEKECYGNYVELCAQKYFPEKWWDFLICEESSVDFSEEGVKNCGKMALVDPDVILKCAKGTEGPLLHLEAADKTPDHRWVPWVVVNDRVLDDGENFLKAVCDAYTGEKPASCKKGLEAEKVKATLYYESFCPGCESLIRSQIKDLRETPDVMAITDLELVPYGNARVITRDPPTFQCQHGDKECYGNYVELCAQKHFSEEKAWQFIVCEETSTDFSEEGVKNCGKMALVDPDVILKCAKGTEGPLLHLEAADKTPDHRWVPWVVVNDRVLDDGENFLKAVCDAYTGEKPASCKKGLEAEKVKATLYYESFCPGCESLIRSQIKDLRETPDVMAITDLELVPYGNARVITRDPPTFQCQHGDKECYGNYVELCAQKHFSEEKAWQFIVCEETSTDFSEEGVKNCGKMALVDPDVILKCAKGTEGPLLHLEAADKTPKDHQWVPWVVVDGKVRNREKVMDMICDAYKGEKPASCKK